MNSKESIKGYTSNKGVTLIALVITIVVLIILAGITIPTLKEDEGIILNAKTAANMHKTAMIKEEIKKMEIEAEAAKNGLAETLPENLDADGVIAILVSKEIVEPGELIRVDGSETSIQYADGSETFSLEGVLQ